MKIGVLSDTHDRLDLTAAGIRLLRERGAELILHCADIESPEAVRLFTEVPARFVVGNWDQSRTELTAAMRDVGADGHGDQGEIEWAGKRITWLHGHVRGGRPRLEHSGRFDYLFYGHSHRAKGHRTGRTLVLHPGCLAPGPAEDRRCKQEAADGWQFGSPRPGRNRPRTLRTSAASCLVDLASGEWEHLAVEGPVR